MATTIGHLALKISAQTGALQQNMQQAERIVDQSGKKMSDTMNKSAGGGFLLNAAKIFVAVQAWKKLVSTVDRGVEALRRAGDPAAERTALQMKKFHEGTSRLEGAFARLLAPMLGKVGEILIDIAERMENLADWIQALSDPGDTRANFERIQAERKAMQADTLRRKALEAAEMERFKRMMDQHKELKNLAEEVASPAQKHLDFIKKWQGRLIDVGLEQKIIANDFDKLLKALDLAADKDPFAVWAESIQEIAKVLKGGDLQAIIRSTGEKLIESAGMGTGSPLGDFQKNLERLRQLQRAGAISDERFFQLLGNQSEKLLADRVQASLGVRPDLKLRGSAEAMGTIAAFQSKTTASEADFGKELVALEKEAARKQQEQIRIGKRMVEELKKKPPVVGK